MKKTFFLIAICFAMATLTSCNDQDRDMNEASPTFQESNLDHKMESFGTTIPVQIIQSDKAYSVAFMVSAQSYFIPSHKTNDEYITILKEALRTQTPIFIYLKKGTHEIAKVEKLSDSEVNEIKKSVFGKDESRIKRNVGKYFINKEEVNGIINILKRAMFSNAETRDVTSIIDVNNRKFYNKFGEINLWKLPIVKYNVKANYSYPKDGCFARATLMSKFLESRGYFCEKIWVYRQYNNDFLNNWNYHVAVAVKDQSGKYYVIDPSLSPNESISREEWVEKCLINKSRASQFKTYLSPTNVFYRSPFNMYQYDRNNYKTICVLNQLRGLNRYSWHNNIQFIACMDLN